MKKNIFAALVMFGVSAGAAQASLVISGVHESARPNTIESYFIKADSTGGLADIFIQSQADTSGFGSFLNGVLSVWRQDGANWVLAGANDDAARVLTATPATSGSTTVFDPTVTINGYIAGDAASGTADPGLKVNLIADTTYMIVQSERNNGPTSLSLDGVPDPANNASNLAGTLGQTFAIGASLPLNTVNALNALYGKGDISGGSPSTYNGIFNNYQLKVNGNVAIASLPVAAVPLPAAVWLFGSALAGLGVVGRKKAERHLVA
jgi:hypothetical protein